MQDRVASIDDYEFDVEIAIAKQLGAKSLPFTGMDKSQSSLCEFYRRASCVRSSNCPYRHSKPGASIVCKHWIRHLCKKGDECEYLHEYDMSKMPECHFFTKFGECHNKDCPYQHIDPESKVKDCFWYDRGYCKHGPNCRHRHVRRVMCVNYLTGFCPDGPRCKFRHPKFDIPMNAPFIDSARYQLIAAGATGVPGAVSQVATAQEAPAPTSNFNVAIPAFNPNPMMQIVRPAGGVLKRPLEQVTCFKCGNKGHYANMCPNSYRSILLSQAQAAAAAHDSTTVTSNQTIQTIGTIGNTTGTVTSVAL